MPASARMKSRCARAVLACCLLVSGVIAHGEAASSTVSLRTSIVDETGEAVPGAAVVIAGKEHLADQAGVVDIQVPRSLNYTLRYQAPSHYPMLHTYSDRERLTYLGELPPVTLVARKEGRSLLAFGGDVMMGRRFHEPQPGDIRRISAGNRLRDSTALLEPMRPYLELADLASVNLESVVIASEPTERSPKSIVFFSYPETLGALAAVGIDYVTLGNNHTYDYLDGALRETLRRLAGSKLGYSGAGLDENEALRPWLTQLDGVEYALYGFVGWKGSVTPNQVAEGNKGGAALSSPDNFSRAFSDAPESAVKVVQVHGGREYSFEPTRQSRARLRRAVEAGADLVIGHHPHVLQGFEMVENTFVAYSLGNFVFDQSFSATQRSALLYVWMDGPQFHRAEIVPVHIRSYRPTPAMGAVRDYVLRRLAEQSRHTGINIGLSGGHGVISTGGSQPASSVADTRTTAQRFPITRTAAYSGGSEEIPESCTAGHDWWAMGDFESEGQYDLSINDWTVFNARHAVVFEEGSDNHALLLRSVDSGGNVSTVAFRQKSYLRVWEQRPASFVLSLRTPVESELRLCLEIQTPGMSDSEARINPVDQCLVARRVSGGDRWEQLAFDFDPPAPESASRLRFRVELKNLKRQAQPTERMVDDVMLVTWSDDHEDRRLNVLRCET